MLQCAETVSEFANAVRVLADASVALPRAALSILAPVEVAGIDFIAGDEQVAANLPTAGFLCTDIDVIAPDFGGLPSVGVSLSAARVAFAAASKDKTVPVLCAARLAVESGEATVAATDRYRIHEASWDAPSTPDMRVLIPRFLGSNAKVRSLVVYKADGEGKDLAVANGSVLLELAEGADNYPPVESIFTDNLPSVFRVERKALHEVLRALKQPGKGDERHYVHVSYRDGILSLVGIDSVTRYQIPCRDLAGEAWPGVVVDGRYLIAAIAALKAHDYVDFAPSGDVPARPVAAAAKAKRATARAKAKPAETPVLEPVSSATPEPATKGKARPDVPPVPPVRPTKPSKEEMAKILEDTKARVKALSVEESAALRASVPDGLQTYSFRNLLLILAQFGAATEVRGFHAWLGMGRAVRRGEKGITILAPVTKRDKDSGEVACVGMRAMTVFDVSQTDLIEAA